MVSSHRENRSSESEISNAPNTLIFLTDVKQTRRSTKQRKIHRGCLINVEQEREGREGRGGGSVGEAENVGYNPVGVTVSYFFFCTEASQLHQRITENIYHAPMR